VVKGRPSCGDEGLGLLLSHRHSPAPQNRTRYVTAMRWTNPTA
jgi:hypothetical protein